MFYLVYQIIQTLMGDGEPKRRSLIDSLANSKRPFYFDFESVIMGVHQACILQVLHCYLSI